MFFYTNDYTHIVGQFLNPSRESFGVCLQVALGVPLARGPTVVDADVLITGLLPALLHHHICHLHVQTLAAGNRTRREGLIASPSCWGNWYRSCFCSWSTDRRQQRFHLTRWHLVLSQASVHSKWGITYWTLFLKSCISYKPEVLIYETLKSFHPLRQIEKYIWFLLFTSCFYGSFYENKIKNIDNTDDNQIHTQKLF